MKKLLHVLLAMGLILGMGLTQEGKVSAEGSKQVFRIGVDVIPGLLDPALTVNDTESSVIKGLFEGLVRLNEKGQAVPGIAKSWKISNGGKTYTFALRTSAKWSNQQPIKAADFEYAWKRALSPQSYNSLAFKMYMIAGAESYHNGKQKDASKVGIKALNDHTLQVTLAAPDYTFLQMLAENIYLPVNTAAVKANTGWAGSAKAIVTNGPFKLAAWDAYQIVLVKNAGYYAAKEIQLSEVHFLKPAAWEPSNTAAFLAGNLDWIGSGENTAIDYYDSITNSENDIEKYTYPYAGLYYYQFNVNEAPFNNVKIRKALAMAVDREGLPYGIPAYGDVAPAISGAKQSFRSEIADSRYFKEDIKLAKKLLQEGLKEEGLKSLPEFNIIVNAEQRHDLIASIIVSGWKEKLGIKANVEVQSWSELLDNRYSQDYTVARAGWRADYNDPATFLEYFTSSSADNDSGWSNKLYDSYILQARQKQEPADRMRLYAKAEKLLIDEMVILPLYYYVADVLKSPSVQGVYVDFDGSIAFTRGYLK
ncbi:peptide ABC transporter substrate-binding protein [Paenibacillus camerounensis]|uniref:peptide ABC transporter substrate-binding protein n=1 Tax=Paenibacillus camerounensis TaxID=1243663 RepID=UPI0005A7C43E|nr:peptide ABC transporter substrate-binding protein [Paenibacillus camerounensis]